mgnify:FL=1
MPQLASIRSNMHLEVDYKNGELVPMVEVIFLLAVPVYSLSSEGETVRNVSLQDMRFKATKANIETLTKQLQEFSKMMETYADLADDFNSAIVESKSPKASND